MFILFLLQKCLLKKGTIQNVFIIIIKTIIMIIIIIIIIYSSLYQGCHTGETASIGNRTHAHAPGSPEHGEPRGPSCSHVKDVFFFSFLPGWPAGLITPCELTRTPNWLRVLMDRHAGPVKLNQSCRSGLAPGQRPGSEPSSPRAVSIPRLVRRPTGSGIKQRPDFPF